MIPGRGACRKRERSPPDSPEKRLLATSHLVEWMLYLPSEFKPPKDVLRRAGIWLLRHLEAKDDTRDAEFCPYTHAVGALECLSQPAPVDER